MSNSEGSNSEGRDVINIHFVSSARVVEQPSPDDRAKPNSLHWRRQTKTVQRYVEPRLPLAEGEIPLALIWIPGGEFKMGSPADEEERELIYAGSETQHLVTVPSFAMGQYPITQAQWRAVAQLSPRQEAALGTIIRGAAVPPVGIGIRAISGPTFLVFGLPVPRPGISSALALLGATVLEILNNFSGQSRIY